MFYIYTIMLKLLDLELFFSYGPIRGKINIKPYFSDVQRKEKSYSGIDVLNLFLISPLLP